jgi:plasmid stability protein
MTDITIDDLEDWEMAALDARAARNGRSIEEEARLILIAGLDGASEEPATSPTPDSAD